jgi:hypothetical protein
VPPCAAGEVLAGVVDDRVGADGPDQGEVSGAAHAGHLGAERFGDLDGEGADAAGRTVDQDLVSRPHLRPIPESLQRRDPAGGNGGGLLEGHRGRLADDRVARAARVLGEAAGAAAPSEDLLGGAQVGELRTDPGDRAGHLRSSDTVPWSA